jgi:hypothetical protein
MENQQELIRASKNGVTLTVLQLLDEGTDPNVADEVLFYIENKAAKARL